jgi:hypothetical protein
LRQRFRLINQVFDRKVSDFRHTHPWVIQLQL